MSLTSVRDIAAVYEIVDPWLRINSHKQALDSGGLYPEGPYAFEGTLRPYAGTAEEAAVTVPSEVRAVMMRRAEAVLDALESAGWHLAGSFAIEITGGSILVPGKPSLQEGMAVKMRFTVDRHRTDEEMAAHPERIADEIFATWARGERPWNG